MMGTAKHIGRTGLLAVAPGIRNFRRTATRMTVSIGVTVAGGDGHGRQASVDGVAGWGWTTRPGTTTRMIMGGTTARRPTTPTSKYQEPVHHADSSGQDITPSR